MSRKNRKMYHKVGKKEKTKPSDDEPVIARKITDAFNLPDDVLINAPILTGYGSHRFCIENYRNIIEYTDEMIRIQTKTCRIHIKGKKLVVAYFRQDAMCVIGNITSIEYY